MVSTSEVVCNTSTPRDRYFSLKECGEDNTIMEDSVPESADNRGVFGMEIRNNDGDGTSTKV
ncbi:hypothetical protein EYF80_019953 [Liparis tanakae]|uniref:Uncharacterized protein n=1 Tax=Liparis tanakae TaxID=230148 RepID=A0A4Z2HX25_9TELE|nr:hypothetical protein EYF80_019953 [Liparis tanakae]